MHPAFAATSRGATLIAALKTSPRETGTAIRVLIEDDVETSRCCSKGPAGGGLVARKTRPLDRAGTRQAARYPMDRRTIAMNGEAAHLSISQSLARRFSDGPAAPHEGRAPRRI